MASTAASRSAAARKAWATIRARRGKGGSHAAIKAHNTRKLQRAWEKGGDPIGVMRSRAPRLAHATRRARRR